MAAYMNRIARTFRVFGGAGLHLDNKSIYLFFII